MTYDYDARRALLTAALVALTTSQAACSLAASGLDAGATKACGPGSTIEFQDDFDDNMKGAQWIKSEGVNITVIESSLEVQITSPGTPMAWGSYTWDLATMGTRSLLGCDVFIEVRQVLSVSEPGTVHLTLSGSSAGQELSFWQTGHKLTPKAIIDHAPPQQPEGAYDPIAQRWWQIGESDGIVFFRTSPDGRAWTEQLNVPTPPFANAVIVSFGAGSDTGFPVAGTAVFDNLNTRP